MAPLLQRKYIDLMHALTSKWVNWDPAIQIQVGTYGTVDKETGNLVVAGNVYDAEFQIEMEKHGLNFKLADHQPVEGPVEGKYIVTSSEAEHKELSADCGLDISGLLTAFIKGQWTFKGGKRGAMLIMHKRRLIHLPHNTVLEHLYEVDKLKDKWLVTGTYVCPAYSMYLSDTKGGKVSLALGAKAPVAGLVGATAGAQVGLDWLSDATAGYLCNACDETDDPRFMPLYALQRPIKPKWKWGRQRGDDTPDPTGDDLWYDASPPWDPLDDEGEEDPLSPSVRAVDPFKQLEEETE